MNLLLAYVLAQAEIQEVSKYLQTGTVLFNTPALDLDVIAPTSIVPPYAKLRRIPQQRVRPL